MSDWQSYLETQKSRFLDELIDFCRIPSISSLPAHISDVQRAAEWTAKRMEIAGIENVEIMPTGGHPVVYGDWLLAGNDKPTVLLYGHFDTQPVDPLELWDNPPFQPTLIDGRLYARGASDDKGGMMLPILAIEATLKTSGKLPINVKCFFEGQEEIGSPQLGDFISQNRALLSCDFAISADGGQFGADQPALLVGLKGLCGLQIDLRGAKSDLHSGVYGGAVQNPLHALAAVIASMRSPEGKILVDGFYDQVRPLTEEERAQIAAVPFDVEEYKAELEIDDTFGEPDYSTLERSWARPTLEVNGMWGGFQGEGTKTVLPNSAHAKITCRLVADQNPLQIAELVADHIARHCPPGVTAEVKIFESVAPPYLMPADHIGNQAAYRVHQQLYDKEPLYVRTGGSIPFCSMMQSLLGIYTVNFGFALEDENIHAPNEFFRIENFEKGQKAYCMLFEELGK